MNDNRTADDQLRHDFDAAALGVARSLGNITAQYGGPLTIAVTLQILAGKAQQEGVSRADFLRTVGMAYDAQAGAWSGGKA